MTGCWVVQPKTTLLKWNLDGFANMLVLCSSDGRTSVCDGACVICSLYWKFLLLLAACLQRSSPSFLPSFRHKHEKHPKIASVSSLSALCSALSCLWSRWKYSRWQLWGVLSPLSLVLRDFLITFDSRAHGAALFTLLSIGSDQFLIKHQAVEVLGFLRLYFDCCRCNLKSVCILSLLLKSMFLWQL